MSKTALLLALALLLIAVIWRIYGYQKQADAWCDGCPQQLTLTLTHQIDHNGSKYIYTYHGLRLECAQNNPKCASFASIKPGSLLEVIGTTEPWLIADRTSKKRLIIQDIKPLKVINSSDLLSPWVWLQKLIDLRSKLIARFDLLLGDPQASLAAGIVLGGRANLSQDFYQALVDTGTLHIIAASGFNISIVANMLIIMLTRIFPRKVALIGAGIGVVIYTILAGASPAVIRAGMMGSALFMAQGVGRHYQAKWLLIMTGVLMLIVSPWLIVDASFQLSIAATAGILWGVPHINAIITNLYKKLRPSYGESSQESSFFVSDLTTTIAATLATLPIITISFGRISLISPIANTLLLWLIPPIMILGGIILLVSYISSGIAQIIGWITWPLLTVFIKCIEAFAKIPYASIEIDVIPWTLGLGFWCLLAAWWHKKAPANKAGHSD